jgi:hypothetical protein
MVGGGVPGHEVVDEVVVLVDQEAEPVGSLADSNQEVTKRVRGFRFGVDRAREMAAVADLKVLDLVVDVVVETADDLVDAAAAADLGKVPLQHEVAVAFRGRLPADVETAEEDVEIVGEAQVVVGGEGLEPERLPEAPRTQEDESPAELLDVAEMRRTVGIEHAAAANALKVGDAVGEGDHGR